MSDHNSAAVGGVAVKGWGADAVLTLTTAVAVAVAVVVIAAAVERESVVMVSKAMSWRK